mgnify:FL=1
MNKQEAIEKLKEVSWECEDNSLVIDLDYAQKTINQIDEPQKVVVPKFVAEWLDEARAEEYSLYGAWEMVKEGSEIFWWLFDSHESNQDTFNRAWLDGYEVETEKLYTVEIPDPYGAYKIRYLFRNDMGNLRIGGGNYRDIFLTTETHLTESEIKQDFKWAWDAGFAKPVEEN